MDGINDMGLLFVVGTTTTSVGSVDGCCVGVGVGVGGCGIGMEVTKSICDTKA